MPKVKTLTIDDVKPLIGSLSRPNYYQVSFGGLSRDLTDYLRDRDVRKSFVGKDVGLMCYNASLPGSSLATVETSNYHGVVENFAHTKIYTTLDLEFYCDDEYRTLKFLEHWMEYVVSGNGTGNSFYAQRNYSHRLKYPSDPRTGYKSEGTKIIKFENSYEQALEYSFIGLFPANLSSTPLRYGPNSEITRVTCSFKYDRYIAGSIYSYDFLRGSGNNLSANIRDSFRDITSGNLVDLINRFIN